jgi:hypothetical protein
VSLRGRGQPWGVVRRFHRECYHNGYYVSIDYLRIINKNAGANSNWHSNERSNGRSLHNLVRSWLFQVVEDQDFDRGFALF